VLIIGGGDAGISVAARMRRAAPAVEVAVLEPSDKHYYQPLWTLVGAGEARKESTVRDEAAYIPRGVTWLRDAGAELLPDHNEVLTRDGRRIGYDFLIVAPGIQVNWDAVAGLREAIGRDGVCSNYAYEYVDKTWEFLRAFRGGTALFTHPNTPIKCGGAPQKIMYLADDHFRRADVRDRSQVIFATAGGGIFSVEKYAKTLNEVVARKGIDVRWKHNLAEVRGAAKQAVFERLDTHERVVIPYDLLHVTPPMSAPDFVRSSPLANEAGWVDVDRATLRHPRYANVFSLGDASSLPTSKTGAAIRAQAPVLVHNLRRVLEGKEPDAAYDGYAACPIVTGYNRLVLAEFDYELAPRESFPFDQSKERRSMYLLKKHGLPLMYWHGILKGRM
jgi:sulfide:quinone oxidoreductase